MLVFTSCDTVYVTTQCVRARTLTVADENKIGARQQKQELARGRTREGESERGRRLTESSLGLGE